MKKLILLVFAFSSILIARGQPDPCSQFDAMVTTGPNGSVHAIVEPYFDVESLTINVIGNDTNFVIQSDSGLVYYTSAPGNYAVWFYFVLENGVTCTDSANIVVPDPTEFYCDYWDVDIFSMDSLVTLNSYCPFELENAAWLISGENYYDTVFINADEINLVLPYGNYDMYVEGTVAGYNCSNYFSITIPNSPDPAYCDANFTIYEDSMINNTIYGINLSEGENLIFTWFFGDGTTSNEAYPTHTYAEPGDYNVMLAVGTEDGSCVDTMLVFLSAPGMTPDDNGKPANLDHTSKSNGFTLHILAPGEVITGTNPPEKITNISVWPNPSEGRLNYQFNSKVSGEGLIKILDQTGKIIFSRRIEVDPGSGMLNLDLSGLKSGMYLIQYIYGNNSHSTKVLIQH